MKEVKYEQLDSAQRKTLDSATAAMEHAYSPYSHFKVGAALLAHDGTVIPGANYENAAYGNTVCAERVAQFSANTLGYRVFDKLAVIGRGETFDTPEVVAPCGTCRQNLNELYQVSGKPLEIIMSNSKRTKIVIASIDELLPMAFGPKDLRIDVSTLR